MLDTETATFNFANQQFLFDWPVSHSMNRDVCLLSMNLFSPLLQAESKGRNASFRTRHYSDNII